MASAWSPWAELLVGGQGEGWRADRGLAPKRPKEWHLNLTPLYILMRSRNCHCQHWRGMMGWERVAPYIFLDGFVKITRVTLDLAERSGPPDPAGQLRPCLLWKHVKHFSFSIKFITNSVKCRKRQRFCVKCRPTWLPGSCSEADELRLRLRLWSRRRLRCCKRGECLDGSASLRSSVSCNSAAVYTSLTHSCPDVLTLWQLETGLPPYLSQQLLP